MSRSFGSSLRSRFYVPLQVNFGVRPHTPCLRQMDQHSGDMDLQSSRFGVDRFLLIAGLAQIGAAFTPAGHVRFVGTIPFIRLPNAGVAFVALGLLTSVVALRPRGWWRWIPGLASAVLLGIVYARLRWEPSGGFADPLLRRVVRPAWGFAPMTLSISLALAAMARVRRGPSPTGPRRTSSSSLSKIPPQRPNDR